MERIDPQALASVLTNTSVSTIADLLTADLSSKARAADRLARTIVERLDPQPRPDPNQLALPL